MRLALLSVAAVLCCAPAAEGKLRFERADGTVLPAGKPHAWCGPWAADSPAPALHVAVPRRDGRFWWYLSAVRRDLRRGKAFTFPHSYLFDRPSKAQLFAVDGGNEVSTAEEESAGRVFYRRISCRPGARVAFTIDATAGSEVSGPTISVSGTFRGRVGTRTWPIP